MPIPVGTYTRVTANQNVREDLIDRITRTDPEQTPVVSGSGTAVTGVPVGVSESMLAMMVYVEVGLMRPEK